MHGPLIFENNYCFFVILIILLDTTPKLLKISFFTFSLEITKKRCLTRSSESRESCLTVICLRHTNTFSSEKKNYFVGNMKFFQNPMTNNFDGLLMNCFFFRDLLQFVIPQFVIPISVLWLVLY